MHIIIVRAIILRIIKNGTSMIDVAVLGATGIVGQKVIELLQGHPIFRLSELSASARRLGHYYGASCHWHGASLSPDIAGMRLKSLDEIGSPMVISCLPSEVAKQQELTLASRGKIVFSNASAHRMDPNVPLLIPEINLSHLSLLKNQHTSGKIIANTNCVVSGVALALAPLMALSLIRHISVVTLQSVSGAGYPGVPALDILSNTIPHIPGEVDKISRELNKVLGGMDSPASFPVTTHVNRVPVKFGHTAVLHITFQDIVSVGSVVQAYKRWNESYPGLFLLHEAEDRPQSIKDLSDDDMRVHIGKISSAHNVVGLVALSHNLVRGAAGAAIYNMESYLKFFGGAIC